MSDAEGSSLMHISTNTTNSSSDDTAAGSSMYSSASSTAQQQYAAKQQRLAATTSELRRINSSLSALGNCIAALGEVTFKHPHTHMYVCTCALYGLYVCNLNVPCVAVVYMMCTIAIRCRHCSVCMRTVHADTVMQCACAAICTVLHCEC
jgi:hypothetical protein